MAAMDATAIDEIWTPSGNIVNRQVFSAETGLTDELFYERPQCRDLLNHWKEFVRDGRHVHIFIIGTRGSGKTHITRYLLEKLHTYVTERDPEHAFTHRYVNCRAAKNSYALMRLILGIHRRIDTLRLQTQFAEEMARLTQRHILVLDEVEALNDFEFFYDISRSPAFSQLQVVCIAKTPKFFKRISDDVLSSLQREFLFFDTYDVPEMRQILAKRAELGLRQYDGPVLLEIAAATVYEANADVRVGLALLQQFFDKYDGTAITVQDSAIQRAAQEEYLTIKAQTIRQLNAVALLVLYFCIKCRGSNRAYAEYSQAVLRPLSRPWFHHIIYDLLYLDLLGIVQVGSRGRPSQFEDVIGDANQRLVEDLVRKSAMIPGLNDYRGPDLIDEEAVR